MQFLRNQNLTGFFVFFMTLSIIIFINLHRHRDKTEKEIERK